MDVLYVILAVLAVYALIMFVGFRLAVPFMQFGGYRLPSHVPTEVAASISELEAQASDQRSYLEAAYRLVLEKNGRQWHHGRFKAATRPHRLFVSDLSEIWGTEQFVYCTGINFVLAVLLVRSKFFADQDIRTRHNFVNMVIHQYLQVKVNGEWIDADPAGAGMRGKPLGTHLGFFG